LTRKNRLVTHAGTAGTASLCDRRPIKHNGLGDSESSGLRDPGVGIQSDPEDLDRLVEGKVNRYLAFLPREILNEDMFDGSAPRRILRSNRCGTVHAIEVQIHSRLAKGMHVGHVRRRWIGELDRDPR